MQISLDALPYRFDPRTGRYRWTEGAGKGQLAPRAAILSLTDRYVKQEGANLIQLGRDWRDGKLSDRDFQIKAGETVRQIHIGAAILGAKGIDNLSNQDWQRIQETIKRHLYKGRDVDGKPFGLKQLVNDRTSGKISDPQFLARLQMVAKAGRITYQQEDAISNIKSGAIEGRRILVAAEHCKDCIRYAGLGWVKLDQLILPGQKCACRSNCKCSIEYR